MPEHLMAKRAVVAAMGLGAIALLLDLAYLVRGSLELFPTPEQQEKVRMVTATIASLLVFTEIALWALLRRLR
jgi:hypothetical protein